MVTYFLWKDFDIKVSDSLPPQVLDVGNLRFGTPQRKELHQTLSPPL